MTRESFKEWKKPEIKEGELTKWNWMVQGVKGLTLGDYVDIGSFSYINAQAGVEIGDYVQIGSHTSIYSVSTIDNKREKVVIEEYACVGSHSVVLPGAYIGKNSIVGAMSLVNKIIPANEVWAGCPARFIRKREERE